jgi:hypothetical protein
MIGMTTHETQDLRGLEGFVNGSRSGQAILRCDLPTTPPTRPALPDTAGAGLSRTSKPPTLISRFFQPCDDITKYGGDDPDKIT